LAINNYLVIGVNPANNETNVPVDKNIVVTFSKHMDQASLNSSNLVLQEVNGAIVPYTMTYNSDLITATLNPGTDLQSGKEYQLQIVGTPSGIKSITGDYMTASRSFEFTTKFTAALSAPTNLVSAVDSGFVTLRWERPATYDTSLPLTYEVQISTSNDPLAAPVWPSTGDINKTNGTIINVPKKLAEGNYYAYVRATNGQEISDWVSVQFLVEAAVTSPTPTQPAPDSGGGDIFSFNVVDTYPRRDDVDVTPEKVMVVFSSNVDPTTVTENTVYIIKKEDKQNLSLLDFMTEYSSDKKVPATLEPMTVPNMVTLTATLEDDAEYTVVIRNTVKSVDGAGLGIDYHWSFMTKFSQIYGDAEMIKNDLGPIGSRLSNKILFKTMRDNSIHAYNIVSQTSTFNAVDYEGGKAPYYVHQYVRFRTAYDLILNGQIQQSSGSGSAVQLGDLRIDKKTSGSTQQSFSLRDFKERIKPWEDAIHGHNNRGYAKPVSVVKGETGATYPDFLTRSEFRDLGQ
jgi:hypothetical protein